MPIGAVLLVELPYPIDEPALAEVREHFVKELRLQGDDFYADGPLRVVRSRADGPIPAAGDERNTWIEVNLWRAYFSPEYLRGDIETIVRCTEWLEARLPGCTVWYGNDVDDDSLAPLPLERRRELIELARHSDR